MFVHSRRFWFFLALGTFAAYAQVNVTLDFAKLEHRVDGFWGYSLAQFADDSAAEHAPVRGVFSNIGGFPDDGSTIFGDYCDRFFSVKYMAAHTFWNTPSFNQVPNGSIGKNYTIASWGNQVFGAYYPNQLKQYGFKLVDSGARGTNIVMMQAALRRARAEGTRMQLWVDVIQNYPSWMWANGSASAALPEDKWEEAGVFLTYYIKYMTSVHGIPITALSHINEPECCIRHHFTVEQSLRFCKVIRDKLDQAGLHGIKLAPGMRWSSGDLNNQFNAYRSLSDYRKYNDFFGFHGFKSTLPDTLRSENGRIWRGAGAYKPFFSTDGGPVRGSDYGTPHFDYGSVTNIDETNRLSCYHIKRGISLVCTWRPPDPSRGHDINQLGGYPAVTPFVRPGMFMVRGSLGNAPSMTYSVDGFAGRGRNEAIVIANGADKRAFKISSNGLTAQIFSVYQCAGSVTRKPLSPVSMSSGVISIEVPANSVTTLVASKPSTASRGYLVVASPAVLTERDRIITDALRSTGIDLQILGSTLNDSDFVRYQEKRHPVDAMGAALYIIAPSVSAKACLYAYRTVAAPVLGFGSVARTILGCEYGKHIRAGSSLSFCDNETDPPANILASGLPLACGDRIVLAGQSIAGDVTVAAQTLLGLPTTGYLSDNRPPAPPQMTTDFRAGDRIEVRDISGRLLRAYGKDGISRVSNENYIYGSGCMVISVVRNGKIIRTHKTHRMR